MKTAWTKGLVGPKREELEREFHASAHIRNRLSVILEEKIKNKKERTISEDAYANPNWAYLQADKAGYERAMNEVISLLLSNSV